MTLTEEAGRRDGGRMRLALAHARAETRQLLRFPRYCGADPRVLRGRALAVRAPFRARRARAAARRLRGDGAAHRRLLPVRRRYRSEPHDALGVLPAHAARVRRHPAGGSSDLCARFRRSNGRHRRRRRDHRLRGIDVPGAIRRAVPRPARGVHPVCVPRDRIRLLVVPEGGPARRERRCFSHSRSAGSCGPARRTMSPASSTSPPRRSRRAAGWRSSTRSRPATTRCRCTTLPPSRPGASSSSGSPGGASAATRASGSAERYQSERRSPATSPGSPGAGSPSRRAAPRWRRRPRRAPPPATPNSRKRPKPPRARELLDPGRRVLGAERRPNRATASGTTASLEPERSGKADRVHRTLRQPVPATECLRHRVTETETRLREGERGAVARPRAGGCARRSRSGFERRRAAARARSRSPRCPRGARREPCEPGW